MRRWGARESDSNITANNFAAAIQVMRDPEKALGRLPSRRAGAPGRAVSSVFFGGGTPSLMRPQTVQASSTP